VIENLTKVEATNELMRPLKPLPFKGGVGVGFGAANLLRGERCCRIATTPTPPLKRRGFS